MLIILELSALGVLSPGPRLPKTLTMIILKGALSWQIFRIFIVILLICTHVHCSAKLTHFFHQRRSFTRAGPDSRNLPNGSVTKWADNE